MPKVTDCSLRAMRAAEPFFPNVFCLNDMQKHK